MAAPSTSSGQAWTERYAGRDGYSRMYRELADSFYREFPDLKGRVAIYNYAAAPATERKRIADELSIAEAGLRDQPSGGIATNYYSLQKDRSAEMRIVVHGWNPASSVDGDWSRVTSKMIFDSAWNTTHEAYHGADMILNENDWTARPDDSMHKWLESFADAGRAGLFIKNYGAQAFQTMALKSFAVAYDADRPVDITTNPDLPLRGQTREQGLREAVTQKYDNGSLILDIYRHTTPRTEQASSYDLHGWRDTFYQVSAARRDWADLEPEQIQVRKASAAILDKAADRFKDLAYESLKGDAGKIRTVADSTVGDYVDNVFLVAGLGEIVEKKLSPDQQELLEKILVQRDDFFKWAGERSDFLPGAARMLAAHEYFDLKTDRVGAYPAERLTDLQGMARGISSYLKSGDPLDREAAELYSLTAAGRPVDVKQGILRELYVDPQLREQLSGQPQAAFGPKIAPPPPAAAKEREPGPVPAPQPGAVLTP